MKDWFKKVNIWIAYLANTKWGTFALFIFAFADASFLPLPVTTFFLVLILLNRRKLYKYILFVVLGTVTGALAGYTIGHYAWVKPDGEFTGVVQFLFNNIPGFSLAVYEKVQTLYTKWDFWILSGATVTPLPYGMFSVTSGAFNINIFIFFVTTLISQAIKYLFLTFFTVIIGPKIRKLSEFDWKPVAIVIPVFIVIIILLTSVL
jgi:membrane protein YqaA with SNARE-associated domain